MARIYGFLTGVVVGLSGVYGGESLIRSNTKAITSELRHADDVARDRSKVIRPYTEPIDLKTQSWRDTVVDMWNKEIIRGMNYVNSLGQK